MPEQVVHRVASQSGALPDVDARITIVGSYGAGNLGDDLLMLATVDALCSVCGPSDVLVVGGEVPEYARSWRPECRFIRHADIGRELRTELLVYGGGTQFFSFPRTARRTGTARALGATLRRILRTAVRPARWKRLIWPPGSPFTRIRFQSAAAAGVGIGPFAPWSEEEVAARLKLCACGYVAVRDSSSLTYCRRWGINHAVLRADPCYSSQVAKLIPEAEGDSGSSGTRRVAVIFRDWPHSDAGAAYFDPLREAVGRMRARGIDTQYVSLCQRSDRAAIETLRSNGENVFVWRPEATRPSEFLATLARNHLLITARAHGAILGAAMGIPSICVEIEPKLRAIAEQLDGGSRVWQRPFAPDGLLTEVEQVLQALPSAVAAVKSGAARLRTTADLAAEELTQFAADRLTR